MRFGFLIRKESLWVGAHYSPYNRRWCVNLVPCLTLWITRKGGTIPNSDGCTGFWASREPDEAVIARRLLRKQVKKAGLRLVEGGK